MRGRGRAAALLLLSMLAPACAETIIPLQTRAPSEAEVKAFHAYYQARFPDNHSAQPAFAVTRGHSAVPWEVSATVNLDPQRGLKQLCRMQRIEFQYAIADKQWTVSDKVHQLVWLERASGCTIPPKPVQLLQRMPDSELVSVLAQQARLLEKARLLLAGNSACARHRSLPFELHAVDVSATGSSSEEMLALTYRSGPMAKATVWARRSGADYDAWNADCL